VFPCRPLHNSCRSATVRVPELVRYFVRHIFTRALHAHVGIAGGLRPVGDLLQGLGQGAHDDVGFAAAEAFDGELGGLVGVFSWVPEADDDAVVGEMRADALTDRSGLGEGEGGKSRDEDDGVGFSGERLEDVGGDGGCGEEEGLVGGLLHELDEHVGGELVGLIAGRDADDGEVVLTLTLTGGARGGGGIGRIFGAVVGEFGDELADAEEEKIAADVVEVALVAVLLDEREGGDEDGVVQLNERFVFEETGGDGVSLALVHGEEALVEQRLGREFGVGAEEGVEERKLRDIAAHDHDADGEGSGEDEAGPSPEQCPEDGHGEQGKRGDAGAGAEEPGFDEVGGCEFEGKEEAEDEEGRAPGGEDGDGDDQGQDEAGRGANVGDDAQDGGENSPEGGVRYADEEEAEAEEGSVGCVDRGLEEEILADAGGGILQGLGHQADAAHAGEEEDAVAEVLALHQQINGEDDDDAEGSNGPEETHEDFGGGLELGALGIDDADGLDLGGGLLGVGRGGVGVAGKVAADASDGLPGVFEGLYGLGMDGADFLLDAGPVFGKAAGDVEELTGDDVSDSTEDREGENAGDCDCEHARDAAGFEAADGGCQQKGQGEGEGEGDEKLAGEEQDEDGNGEHEKGSNPGRLGGSSTGHKTSESQEGWSGLSGQEYMKSTAIEPRSSPERKPRKENRDGGSGARRR
jgi:hypothetical protein